MEADYTGAEEQDLRKMVYWLVYDVKTTKAQYMAEVGNTYYCITS